MNESIRPYHEMHFYIKSEVVNLNRCCLCRNFSVPYSVGLCKYTPPFLQIDQCSRFEELEEYEFFQRIEELLKMGHTDAE